MFGIDIQKITEIGERVTSFVAWGQNAITGLGVQNRQLYALAEKLERNQVLIMQHLGVDYVGNKDGFGSGEVIHLQSRDGGERGNAGGNSHGNIA